MFHRMPNFYQGGALFRHRPGHETHCNFYNFYQFLILILIYLLTAIGLKPGSSSTVHIYTQTMHRTTQNKQCIEQHNNLGECGPCPVYSNYTLRIHHNGSFPKHARVVILPK